MSNRHATPVENIWLMRESKNGLEYAVVYVQREGIWYEAICELLDGQFSHCISSHGLVSELCTPATRLNELAAPWIKRAEEANNEQV